jgi:hypothetical protein
MMIITSQLETPSAGYDEHNSKLFPQLETKVLSIRRGANKRLKVMLLARDSFGQFIGRLVQALLC